MPATSPRGRRPSSGWKRCTARWWTSRDRKSTRLNSSHANISYAVFCLKKKTRDNQVQDFEYSDGRKDRPLPLLACQYAAGYFPASRLVVDLLDVQTLRSWIE